MTTQQINSIIKYATRGKANSEYELRMFCKRESYIKIIEFLNKYTSEPIVLR